MLLFLCLREEFTKVNENFYLRLRYFFWLARCFSVSGKYLSLGSLVQDVKCLSRFSYFAAFSLAKPILYHRFLSIPPENNEKQRLYIVFRGYRKRPVTWNGMKTRNKPRKKLMISSTYPPSHKLSVGATKRVLIAFPIHMSHVFIKMTGFLIILPSAAVDK